METSELQSFRTQGTERESDRFTWVTLLNCLPVVRWVVSSPSAAEKLPSSHVVLFSGQGIDQCSENKPVY